MLALRLMLMEKGGQQRCLPSIGSNLGIEMFLKKEGTSEKWCAEIED